MTNPFATADPWTVSTDTILPAGNHVCTIEDIDDKDRSKSGYFQWKIKLVNTEGSITDWMVIDPTAGPRKLMGLASAVGVSAPADTDLDGPDNLDLSDSYRKRFLGKKVGVVARDEEKWNDPTQTPVRVQGYVPPEQIKPLPGQSDVTPPSATNAFQQSASQSSFGSFGGSGAASGIDGDIPF
jgi:hypothetical protein